MTWPTYSAYENQGVTWLDEYPADWNATPLRILAGMQSGESITSESIEDSGEYPVYGGNGLRGYTSAYTHQGERVLIGRQGALCGNIHLVSGKYWASEHAIVMTPRRGVSPAWLAYLLEMMNLGQYSQAAAQPGISADVIGKLRVPTPPPSEQDQIVRFLDRETAKIDALIAKQEQLIATLREDRTATITHAVTKGLDPDAEFKESHIEWAGSIPAGWGVSQINHMFTVTLGKMLQTAPNGDADRLQPYLRAAHIPPSGFTTEGATEMWFSPREVRELTLLRGDVVVVEGGMGGYGRCDSVPIDLEGWGFQNSINRLRPRGGNVGAYAKYALQMAREHGFMEALCSVSTMPHLTAEKLGAMRIPAPPVAEQVAIVAFLYMRCEKIAALIAKAEEVIATLQEYRAALITDAVTGKIDVRGVA